LPRRREAPKFAAARWPRFAVRLSPRNTRFHPLPIDDWDRWNSDRDHIIRDANSWRHTNRYYTGAQDLDTYGQWRHVEPAFAILGLATERVIEPMSVEGGYVSASNETGAGAKASATVVYRIPAAAWDATLAGLRGLATTVRHQQVSTEEVTGQVVDLGARIANLRATEAALQAIMARATKIADVLAVQEQLTTTRGEIERLVADKATLEGRAAYGSLKVTFALPAPAAVDTAQKGWDPATDVDRATGKLIRIGQRATSAGIFLGIVGLPVLIVGAVGLFVAWQLYRLGRRLFRRRTPEAGLSG